MLRVLVLVAVFAVVLLNCSAKASVLRELIQEYLDKKSVGFDQNLPHALAQRANESLTYADEYLAVVDLILSSLGDEDEKKILLTPICQKFLTYRLINRMTSFRTSLSSSENQISNMGDRRRPAFCARFGDMDSVNDGNNGMISEESEDPTIIRENMEKDVLAAANGFNHIYILCTEERERDIEDLNNLLSKLERLSSKVISFKNECGKKHLTIPNN